LLRLEYINVLIQKQAPDIPDFSLFDLHIVGQESINTPHGLNGGGFALLIHQVRQLLLRLPGIVHAVCQQQHRLQGKGHGFAVFF